MNIYKTKAVIVNFRDMAYKSDLLNGLSQAGELRGEFLSKAEGQVRTAALAVMTCKTATRESWERERKRKREEEEAPSTAEEGSVSSSGGQARGSSCQDTAAVQDTATQDVGSSVAVSLTKRLICA